MLREHARSVCGPETIVEVHGVETGNWLPGAYFKYSGQGNHLKVTQIIENAIRAEREGYDAVALSVFLDPGLEEARGIVDIPVVSSLETALEVASKLGHSFGLITRAKWMNARVRALIRQYKYEDRVAVLTPLEFSMGLDELDKVSAGSREFIDRFTRQASQLIRSGVDVIIPAEGLLNTVLVRNGVHEIEGVRVLDSYGALLAYAEMLVRIRRCSGPPVERERIPDQVADQLRRATAAVLLRSSGPG
jgi:Asp/Glu/hydantoin racemase